MSYRKYDFSAVHKIIFIGDPAVGKTSIVRRFTNKEFREDYLPTIGVDLYSLSDELEIAGKRIKITWQIWDLAGHPMWYEVRSSAYTGAHGAVLVYDITRRETYEHVPFWLEEFMKHAGKKPIVLVANKIDMRRKVKTVTKREGMKLRKNLEKIVGFPVAYVETSALEDININEIFKKMAEILFSEIIKQG